MQETTLPLEGLSSVRGKHVRGKPVIARFDGGMLSSDRGVLALGEIERRLRISDRLAACIADPQGFLTRRRHWTRTERAVARVEVGPRGADTRYVVTNPTGGRAKTIDEAVYCARGQAENHIKAFRTHLAADRTSCTKSTANQFRLFLHAGAFWLPWALRVIKIPARIVEMKNQIRFSLTLPPKNVSQG